MFQKDLHFAAPATNDKFIIKLMIVMKANVIDGYSICTVNLCGNRADFVD